MRKRFKFKKYKKIKHLNKVVVLIILIISIINIYKLIYKKYISTLTNQEIITHIITTSKLSNNPNSILNSLLNPKNIIKEQFEINEETIEVNNIPKEPLIYIYCTHETESYKDQYLEAYNIKPTIKNMSFILQDYLNTMGVPSIVEQNSVTDILHINDWSYKYSYDASRILVENVIKENPSLILIIDLHRDSASLEKTLLEYESKKYAKILFVVGKEHSLYEENYSLSKEIQALLENEIPNITRGITIKEGKGVNGIYNQDLSPNSILIELGGQYNQIEEINNTLEVLSKVLLKYIEEKNEKF